MQQKRWGIQGAILVLLAGGFFVTWWNSRTGAGQMNQPIQFSHALHSKNNVKCLVCHPYYETTARAGLPGVETCRRCHEDVIQVGPEERKIEAYYQSGREIPWKRIYRVPSHVFFSHRRHVALGRIECRICHGEVAALREPVAEPLKALKMDDCIDCHRRQQEKTSIRNVNECIRCHR